MTIGNLLLLAELLFDAVGGGGEHPSPLLPLSIGCRVPLPLLLLFDVPPIDDGDVCWPPPEPAALLAMTVDAVDVTVGVVVAA